MLRRRDAARREQDHRDDEPPHGRSGPLPRADRRGRRRRRGSSAAGDAERRSSSTTPSRPISRRLRGERRGTRGCRGGRRCARRALLARAHRGLGLGGDGGGRLGHDLHHGAERGLALRIDGERVVHLADGAGARGPGGLGALRRRRSRASAPMASARVLAGHRPAARRRRDRPPGSRSTASARSRALVEALARLVVGGADADGLELGGDLEVGEALGDARVVVPGDGVARRPRRCCRRAPGGAA